jgi:hypothetical protein
MPGRDKKRRTSSRMQNWESCLRLPSGSSVALEARSNQGIRDWKLVGQETAEPAREAAATDAASDENSELRSSRERPQPARVVPIFSRSASVNCSKTCAAISFSLNAASYSSSVRPCGHPLIVDIAIAGAVLLTGRVELRYPLARIERALSLLIAQKPPFRFRPQPVKRAFSVSFHSRSL